MTDALKKLVRIRAGNACEYCLLPQEMDVLPFQIDHVIAEKHRGQTVLENLALSCLHDNLHKGPNIAGLDPDTELLTRLYNPRTDDWTEHFAWIGPYVAGITAIGRTTVEVLQMNVQDRVEHRRLLIRAGLFPASVTPKSEKKPGE